MTEYLKIITKRLWFIFLFTVAITWVGWSVSHSLFTLQYKAEIQMLVYKPNIEELGTVELADINDQNKLVTTYIDLIKSDHILELSARNISSDERLAEIKNKVNVKNNEDSQVITVSVTDKDPSRAKLFAEMISNTFKQEVTNFMKIDNVQILSEANVNELPVKSKKLLFLGISMAAGIILSSGLVFMYEALRGKNRR